MTIPKWGRDLLWLHNILQDVPWQNRHSAFKRLRPIFGLPKWQVEAYFSLSRFIPVAREVATGRIPIALCPSVMEDGLILTFKVCATCKYSQYTTARDLLDAPGKITCAADCGNIDNEQIDCLQDRGCCHHHDPNHGMWTVLFYEQTEGLPANVGMRRLWSVRSTARSYFLNDDVSVWGSDSDSSDDED